MPMTKDQAERYARAHASGEALCDRCGVHLAVEELETMMRMNY
jgi:hypothetical protein